MMLSKKARISTYLLFIVILFSLVFFVLADNLTGDLTSAKAGDATNETLSNLSLDDSGNFSQAISNVSIIFDDSGSTSNQSEDDIQPLKKIVNLESNQSNNRSHLQPLIKLKDRRGQKLGRFVLTERDNGTYDLELHSDKPLLKAKAVRLDKLKSKLKQNGNGRSNGRGDRKVGSEEAEDSNASVRIRGIKGDPTEITAMIDSLDDNAAAIDGGQINTEVVAVSEVEIEEAVIQLPKAGFVNKILRCTDFDEEQFSCSQWEVTDIPFVDHGDHIEFNVTHFSAYAGGEIIAIDAVHLDENYSIVSNIYADVELQDGVWSEAIYADEYVRVTFEQDLTDGRYIDVTARSNGTVAYFEVYEADTNHLVGRSAVINGPEHQYLLVDGLTEPTDTFDFKIVAALSPIEEVNQCISYCPVTCNEDSYDGCFAGCSDDCDTVTAHEDRTVFVQFDFIHDDAITATQADGMIVYDELNVQTPRYRLWNESNNFTAELTNTQNVGGDITWNLLRGNHERDEFILGTEDKNNDVNVQVYSNGAWGNLLEVSADVQNSNSRGFSIAYEDVSGDALIVYENLSSNDQFFKYRIWNGTSYSNEFTLQTGLPSSSVRWINAIPRSGSDEIMVLVHNNAGDLHAQLWNGTSFDNIHNLTMSLSTTTNTEEHFNFQWESKSDDGIIMYGVGSNLVYRAFSLTAPYWTAETSISLGNPLHGLRMCADPTSDYIGIIVQDGGNDLNVRMWDGTQILAGPPTEDILVEPDGSNNANIDCGWYNSSSALFGFIDQTGGGNGLLSMDYFTFTKTNTWSDPSLGIPLLLLDNAPTTVNFASDDIDGLRFAEHPTLPEIMVTAQDLQERVALIRWNGTRFRGVGESPVETATEVTNGGQESAFFEWSRYDPVPNVTAVNPSGLNFPANTLISLNATVRDNVGVSVVVANVTFPNSSIQSFTLLDSDADNIFNSTLITALSGFYTVRIFANDTSTHRNLNSSESVTFSVGDPFFPNVTTLIPSSGSVFSPQALVEIAANVTDNVLVDTVLANLTFPNGTTETITLANGTNYIHKYNVSLNVGRRIGNYSVRFIANDSSNNINSTETTSFTVVDNVPPNVTDLIPATGSNFNLGAVSVIQFSANISDDVYISQFYANLTYPNGSLEQFTLNNNTGFFNKFNTSFAVPDKIGTYTLRFFANDTSNNRNSTQITTFTISDVTPPNVTDIKPVQSGSHNISSVVEISVNASDVIIIDTVLANITYPNGSQEKIFLSNSSGYFNKFNVSYIVPNVVGVINITLFVNDTSDNLNSTEFTNFTTNDGTRPKTSVLIPPPGSTFAQNTNVSITVNVTDNIAVSTVVINVTLPNGTRRQSTLTDADADGLYYFNFTETPDTGSYNIRVIANDTNDNINRTTTRIFNVQDNNNPIVNLISPADEAVVTALPVTFRCNATDNTALSNITLYLNVTGVFAANQTIAVNGTNNQTNFSVSLDDGNYIWNCLALDEGGNPSFGSANFTVSINTLPPAVTPLSPANGSTFNITDTVNITALVTDSFVISRAVVNVTLPNGSIQQIPLQDEESDSTYNGTFLIPNKIGAYTIRYIANDTSKNTNSTEIVSFTAVDPFPPKVTDLRPVQNSTYNLSNTIEISANVSDTIFVSLVSANITFPNGTIQELTLSNSTGYGNKFNSSFTIPQLVGNYSVLFIANDTSNNFNSTETVNFTVNDVLAPNVTLNTPLNNTNTSSASVIFNITVADDALTALTCNLYINSTLNLTNASVVDGVTQFDIPLIEDGPHSWYVNCTDASGNFNTTGSRVFTVDTQLPQFNNFTTSPNSEADLDPDVNVTVFAGVTDNVTGINTVILQRKLSNDTDASYINVTMTYNPFTGLYNASFNATQNGTYNLRLFANDTVGNREVSTLVNISVQLDRNWTRSPGTFTVVTATASQNVTVGNLTINNTGDFPFVFTIVSNSSTTRYNETENFTLAAGQVKFLAINETAPLGGLKVFTLNISVNDTAATPYSQISTGSVLVAGNQPVLSASFTTPNAETRQVTQGNTGVAFVATLTNIGIGNATNVTFTITLPSEWTITFGDPNLTVGNLSSGESAEISLEVTIPADATIGTFTVLANATGNNATNGSLNGAGLIFSDSVAVTVNSATTIGGGGEPTSGSGGGPTPSGTAPSGGGGGGGSSGRVTKGTLGGQSETIETVDEFLVPRGTGASTHFTVRNLWQNAFMENIDLKVSGFLESYVIISPELNRNRVVEVKAVSHTPQLFELPGIGFHTLTVDELKFEKVTVTIESEPQVLDLKTGRLRYVDLDGDHFGDIALELEEIVGEEAQLNIYPVKDYENRRLAYGESLNYSLDVYAPSYLTQKDYQVDLQIESTLTPLNATQAGFTQKVITELRTLLFKIQGADAELAQSKLNLAREMVQEMYDASFNAVEVQDLLLQAEAAFEEADYDQVLALGEKITEIYDDAFAAAEIITLVKQQQQDAKDRWLGTPQTDEALGLAQVAFERGDYDTALERAKNAQLVAVLEIKGKVNVIKFVIDWWWALLLAVLVLSGLLYFVYKRSVIFTIEHRLKNLTKEEDTLHELLEETQKKYFQEKSLSDQQYQRYVSEYQKRLASIGQIRAKLRNKRVKILKTEQELLSIKKEKDEVEGLLKKNQKDYFIDKKFGSQRFKENEQLHKTRLAEIDKEEAILEEKLSRKMDQRGYKLLERFRRRKKEEEKLALQPEAAVETEQVVAPQQERDLGKKDVEEKPVQKKKKKRRFWHKKRRKEEEVSEEKEPGEKEPKTDKQDTAEETAETAEPGKEVEPEEKSGDAEENKSLEEKDASQKHSSQKHSSQKQSPKNKEDSKNEPEKEHTEKKPNEKLSKSKWSGGRHKSDHKSQKHGKSPNILPLLISPQPESSRPEETRRKAKYVVPIDQPAGHKPHEHHPAKASRRAVDTTILMNMFDQPSGRSSSAQSSSSKDIRSQFAAFERGEISLSRRFRKDVDLKSTKDVPSPLRGSTARKSSSAETGYRPGSRSRRITNTPKDVSSVERLSEKELRKRFPGAFK
ncbi:hypothetical protein COV20_00795 [Candidatus Woesearchaeota archaeon CG10_big_fil_rev_8_21_14_0_10_45_16]|nr:MAG: hypothetical protein COV20_00795 [Candidatus Woesearchaeota archaeon CG10_big_fil_rev_8_21_14_0_10_45_16]